MNTQKIPFFGARKFAAQLLCDLELTIQQRDQAHSQLRELGGLTILELNERKNKVESEVRNSQERLSSLNQKLETSLITRCPHD